MEFRLTEHFVEQYKRKRPPFGFNGLGELVYYRTYSRIKENGKNERWWETIRRVVEGTYNMQKKHIDKYGLGWNAHKAQLSAQNMYHLMFNMYFLPPGRGLWAMGAPICTEREMYMALNNCGFVSTDNLKHDLMKPFEFLMDASMLGVGVGFDTKGAGQFDIRDPKLQDDNVFTIPDSREGWVQSVSHVLSGFFMGTVIPRFDYSEIRQAGLPIVGFGGTASGPRPLRDLHNSLQEVLAPCIGQPISSQNIVDIMNLIGKCVVAGNVRRTAEIAFGEPDDDVYLDLKNYDKNPERAQYGWTSNNSIFSYLGMEYDSPAKRTSANGEPGYAWLENMRAFSRMGQPRDNKDNRVAGGNPCLEQSLESYELCCLVETFPFRHATLEDYKKTLKYAYLYAKTVTLGNTHWAETNRVLLRNRRIGCSMSGIAQFVETKGIHNFREWCEQGYGIVQHHDKEFSDWLAIPRSIKTTSIKPSGTVSLLAGATPGMHFPESRYYIRRMRLGIDSALVAPLRDAGYHIEPAFGSEDDTVVVSIPVDVGEGIRTVSQVSMWEQFALSAFLHKHWADNQVSCTVTFDPKTEGPQIAAALNYYQYQLKGISLLPKLEHGAFPQMPYEEIDEKKYKKMVSKLGKLSFAGVSAEEAEVERFCDGDKCTI